MSFFLIWAQLEIWVALQVGDFECRPRRKDKSHSFHRSRQRSRSAKSEVVKEEKNGEGRHKVFSNFDFLRPRIKHLSTDTK
jgi:hypothetical protein